MHSLCFTSRYSLRTIPFHIRTFIFFIFIDGQICNLVHVCVKHTICDRCDISCKKKCGCGVLAVLCILVGVRHPFSFKQGWCRQSRPILVLLLLFYVTRFFYTDWFLLCLLAQFF
ncbi:hypothetical protein EI94DRAFT_1745947 [Lactarius quietus]|nr:hypothetical protein EI94DRAFT_1745947 [Lactarius quietus]